MRWMLGALVMFGEDSPILGQIGERPLRDVIDEFEACWSIKSCTGAH